MYVPHTRQHVNNSSFIEFDRLLGLTYHIQQVIVVLLWLIDRRNRSDEISELHPMYSYTLITGIYIYIIIIYIYIIIILSSS